MQSTNHVGEMLEKSASALRCRKISAFLSKWQKSARLLIWQKNQPVHADGKNQSVY